MKYIATTGDALSAGEAILRGINGDGNIYVPSSFPLLRGAELADLVHQNFQERIAKVLSLFIDELPFEQLLNIANKAYADFDDVCPLIKIESGLYIAELWHGKNACASDLVYAIYPHIVEALSALKPFAVINGSSVNARAMLSGFGRAGVAVAFFSNEAKSDFERLQLTTVNEAGASVFATDCGPQQLRAKLKAICRDADLRKELKSGGVILCSEGGPDLLKILIQVAIFVSAYCDLIGSGELESCQELNFALASGELDCAVAGSYARRMGVPVKTFILAANANNAVTELVEDGKFDADRDFYRTISYEFDILVPRELERFVFELTGGDGELTAEAMDSLKKRGGFEIDIDDFENSALFRSGWADEEDTKQTIFSFFDLDDYIMDTHTAVAASVYNDYSCDTEDDTPTVILSTSNACRTAPSVLDALGSRERDPFKAIEKLINLTAIDCPDYLFDFEHSEEICVGHAKLEDIGSLICSLAAVKKD